MPDQIYGIHAVKQRLTVGAGIVRLIIRPGKLSNRHEELMQLAESIQCPVERHEIELSDGRLAHQGVALVVDAQRMLGDGDLADILAQARNDWLFLVLDGVTDARNFGACIRSAAGMGVTAIIVPKDRSASLNEAAIKVASGGASLVPVIAVVNLARALDKMKAQNVWIVGTVLDEERSISDIELTGNIAIILGAEDTGIRLKTRERCDFLAMIPMSYPDLSLNVSVATGICLYEAQKQRLSAKLPDL